MANDDPTPEARRPLAPLSERWWLMVIRGVIAIVGGMGAFTLPRKSLFAFIVLFGAYAMVDGVLAILHASRGNGTRASRWAWLGSEGIVGSGVGLLAIIYPGLTLRALVTLVAIWAFWAGIARMVSVPRLRRMIRHEWLLGASGILAASFAAVLAVFGVANVAALAWLFGVYAIFVGVLLVALGLRLHAVQIPIVAGRAPKPF